MKLGTPDSLDAANMLADISDKLTKLVEYVVSNDPDREGIQQLNVILIVVI